MAKDKATMSMGTEDVAREIALLSKDFYPRPPRGGRPYNG